MANPESIMSADEAWLWQQMMKRVKALEDSSNRNVPTGAIMSHGGPLRSSIWSDNRLAAIGSGYNVFYRFNEITWPLVDINGVNPLAQVTGFTPGQPGLLSSEGSYSLQCTASSNMTAGGIATGSANWSIEAVFRPDDLTPGVVNWNGVPGSDGYGICIETGGHLTIEGQGMATIDTGIVLVAKNIYDVIFVSDSTANLVRWSVGRFDPSAQNFTTAPTGNAYFGHFNGQLDEILIYNGKVAEAANTRQTVEDRVRAALEPAPPSGWLKTDGTAVARNKYAQLFNAIGTQNGAGDGSTTFNIPNVAGSMIKI
jgi:hypothetical protein